MAKSKPQKQQEAAWRLVRGKLVEAFRAGSDDKVMDEYGRWFIEKRELLWQEYLALPQEWRATAMEGWNIPVQLQDRLDLHAIEEQAQALDAAAPKVSTSRVRMRF